IQHQLLQLQKELRTIETKKNVQKLILKLSEKFYGLIRQTVNDREKNALKSKIMALEGKNDELSERLGRAILEKERNETRALKAENNRNYYKEQMENARGTSERLRTEKRELAENVRELKKELGTMKDMFNSEQLAFLKHHLPKIAEAMNEGKELLRQVKPGWGKLSI
ncbi:mobilization protein, partial [Bacteroides fragilis]|nr:mobilization protein [Bacteroides fragilis]